jgi:hypothetical protein
MSPPFDLLREKLLQAGVRPAGVRRYLAELADHYEDLLAEEEESGKIGGIARTAALLRLGSVDDLAEAMMSQSRFRSLAARAPWAFFPGGAVLALATAYGATTALMLGAVYAFALPVGMHLMPPAWLPPVADAVFTFDRYGLPTLLGWLVGLVALRQRLPAGWPVAAMLCLSLIGAGLYCRADWPTRPTAWSFHVGSLLDEQAQPASIAGYSAHVIASFLAAVLPYLALRRRLKMGVAGLVLAGLLTGCAASPPPADELLRRIAARPGGGDETGVVAQTPEDQAAMESAAAEIRTHVAAVPDVPPPPGIADGTYQIAVTAPHSMAGSWKMVSPTRLDMRRDEPDSYTKVQTFLCRLDQDGENLEGSCLPSRKRVHGSLRGDEVHLGWQSGLIGAEIRGRLLTPTDFVGTFALGTLGIGVVATDIPAYGSKIFGVPAAPDGVGELETALAADLAADEMLHLGSVRGLSLLGSVEKPVGEGDKAAAVQMAVYDVEFARGWKLCGFTRDGQDRIDSVECR